jgi:geranylgeranyl pyrophosphate synthase
VKTVRAISFPRADFRRTGGPLGARAMNTLLDLHAAEVPRGVWARSLFGPIREFLDRPGKGFRASLVVAGWKLAGGPGKVPPVLARFVEQLHAGSLIVDDIEDGARERRGGPALHRTHGVPIALNAGNFLYFWPLAQLSTLNLPLSRELGIYRDYATTIVRCHAGQALDLAIRVWDLPQGDVERVVLAATRLKTGSLTEFAMVLGARAAGADARSRRAFGRLGRELGIVLQMLDDLSGIVNRGRRHKGHEDLVQGRLTWAWVWAAEWSDAKAYARLRKRARQVDRASASPDGLSREIRTLIRQRARGIVRERLSKALAGFQESFGPSRAFRKLQDDVRQLERSFVCDD